MSDFHVAYGMARRARGLSMTGPSEAAPERDSPEMLDLLIARRKAREEALIPQLPEEPEEDFKSLEEPQSVVDPLVARRERIKSILGR